MIPQNIIFFASSRTVSLAVLLTNLTRPQKKTRSAQAARSGTSLAKNSAKIHTTDLKSGGGNGQPIKNSPPPTKPNIVAETISGGEKEKTTIKTNMHAKNFFIFFSKEWLDWITQLRNISSRDLAKRTFDSACNCP